MIRILHKVNCMTRFHLIDGSKELYGGFPKIIGEGSFSAIDGTPATSLKQKLSEHCHSHLKTHQILTLLTQ